MLLNCSPSRKITWSTRSLDSNAWTTLHRRALLVCVRTGTATDALIKASQGAPSKVQRRNRLIGDDQHSLASDVICQQVRLLQQVRADVNWVCPIAKINGHGLHHRSRCSSAAAFYMPNRRSCGVPADGRPYRDRKAHREQLGKAALVRRRCDAVWRGSGIRGRNVQSKSPSRPRVQSWCCVG